MKPLSSLEPLSSLSAGTSTPCWVDKNGTFHEQYTALVLVGNDLLGTFTIDPGAWPSLSYRRSGVAYYCPWCGDIWARVVFTDSRGIQASLDITTVSCIRHPDQWDLAGSLLAGRLEALIEHLPLDAVKREFEIHMNEAEKEI